MPELRWILLALGAAFCLGLWWWEARRGRQAADSRASLGPIETFTSTSTTVVRDAHAEGEAARELPPWNATIAGEASEGAEQDEEGVPWEEPAPTAARPAPSHATRDVVMFDAPEPDEAASEPLIDIAAVRRSRLESGHADAGFEAARGVARIEPTIGDVAAVVGRATDKRIDESLAPRGAGSAPGASVEERTHHKGVGQIGAEARRDVDDPAEPSRQKVDVAVEEKIVTLRVAAPPLERFEGRRLVAALRAAGLEHGKFAIFHRTAADGATLFSVASLVEPGTFDLDALDGRRFPGVSLFAVLRAKPECAALVEEMLGTARSLAATLHGTVQDERGVPLSPQRLADLRADVAAWVRRAGA